jgi:carbonic anhydrase/acetyltransferase-like protein (isoleucine patch superfamily)
MASPPRLVVARLKAIQAWDRYRLRAIERRHAGLHIHAEASSNLAAAQFDLAPGAQLRIGARVTTERRPMALRFLLGEGARVEIGEDTWLRTEVDRVVVFAGPGARIHVGPEGFLNGCHLSAKASITLGRHAWVAGDVTVLRGVTIGAHSVIGARSLVNRSVPPHTLAFGTPAVARGDVGDRSGTH